MKPIGGIVTNKKSIPDSFRKVDTFTTEDLSRLWKVYSINRDVVEKGRRLENLFWRIWGSERTGRPFSGIKVSEIFMRIYQEDDFPARKKSRAVDLDIKISERGQPAPPPPPPEGIETLEPTVGTPRASMEIECPPTPPPSPVPNSMHGGFSTHSFLSKLPQLSEITRSLQRSIPGQRPPTNGSMSIAQLPPSPVLLDAPLGFVQPQPQPQSLQPQPQIQVASSPKKPLQSPRRPSAMTALSTVTESKESEWVSTSFQSENSFSKSPKTGKAIAKAEQPRKGRRNKKVVLSSGRGHRVSQVQPSRAASGRNSKSNTTANSPSNTTTTSTVTTANATTTVAAASALPSINPPNPNDAATPSSGKDSRPGGWIVDPDFRTKYIDKKQKQKEILARVGRAPANTAQPPRSASSSSSSAKRVTRGKRKSVLVVDEIVPLKEVHEDEAPVQKTEQVLAAGEFVVGLPRQKSQLTMMIENARRRESAGADAGEPPNRPDKGKRRVR